MLVICLFWSGAGLRKSCIIWFCKINTYSQKSASIQPRMSLPKCGQKISGKMHFIWTSFEARISNEQWESIEIKKTFTQKMHFSMRNSKYISTLGYDTFGLTILGCIHTERIRQERKCEVVGLSSRANTSVSFLSVWMTSHRAMILGCCSSLSRLISRIVVDGMPSSSASRRMVFKA